VSSRTAPRPLSAPFQQQVENALARLESLQMLARPVQSADGEQHQVMVLPMRIDDEWAEVRVRFVKKRKGKSGKKGGERYAVSLTVSPSSLGEITVHMDYHRRGAFSVRMDFERPAVRRWFLKRDRDLASALQALGLTSVHLDLARAGERGVDRWMPTEAGGKAGRRGVDVWG
jgi:hypothetical protein